MNDDQGIVPQANDLPGLDMDEVVEKQAIDEAAQEEQAIASLSATKGWQKIAGKMQADIDGLRTGSSVNIDDKTPLELVGQKYLIAVTVATHLQSYLDMVSNAQKATAEYEQRKRTSKE